MSYSISDFGDMQADGIRMPAYEEALRRALSVRPDAVVLDIGTGTGIMALLACRLGAARVYAVEPLEAIEVGRRIAADNGLAERILFRQALSTQVTLPERVDVVVSDLRGVLPTQPGHLEAIADARSRHLKPGGVLIPRRDRLFAAPVAAEAKHRSLVAPWADDNPWRLDLGAARALVTGQVVKHRVKSGDLVAPAAHWATMDYETLDPGPVAGKAHWTLERSATVHGLSLWFDTELADSVGFSSGPSSSSTVYGQAFLPWPAGVSVNAGDTIRADLRADPVGADWVWRWTTTIAPADGADATRFAQSTLAGTPLGLARLHRMADDHVPTPGPDVAVDAVLLPLLDGTRSLGEIARVLAERFPDRFVTWVDALGHVGDVAERYHRAHD